MSNVDSAQVEKIVSLLHGSSEYQTQALELITALANPDLTKAVRTKVQSSLTICDTKIRLNISGANRGSSLDEEQLQQFITVGLLEKTDVKHAFFEDIDIADLEDVIQKYPYLETLKIKSSDNYFSWRASPVVLTELPENIGTLSRLKYLYIENHWRLKTLPESMSQLTQLEKVSFARTGLTVLPSWLMNCPNLTVLNINGMDKLKAIHPALMNHPSLKRIHGFQNSRFGTVNPALPNTRDTCEKYNGSVVHWGTRYPTQERLSKHESKWRQQAYLRKRFNR